MQRRHGTRQNSALETVTHDQVITFAQLIYEFVQVREVVAVIGVPHENEASPGGGDSSAQGTSIAAGFDGHHPGTAVQGNLLRTIGTSIIRDDYLALDLMPDHGLQNFLDADAHGRAFIQAGHHDREFDVLSRRSNGI